MAPVGSMARAYRFGRFVLEPARRALCANGEPVPLGSRAFDILELLIERRHTVVSRDDILAHVWRGTVVEGNTLAVQISALRRALGEPPMIVTIAGRGYRFVGSVLDESAPDVPSDTPADADRADHMSARAAAVPMPRALPRPPRWAVVVVAVLGAGLFVARGRLWPPHVAPRLSIVVLPFRNLGHDAEQDYLADAISDDLTTDLSHMPGSVVIARTSADSYKGRAVPTDEIGRALDVRYVLEGSLLAEGGHLHINAQLIDAPSGAHLWARAFDVPRDRLGEARSEIVQQIGSALNVTLVDVEGARSLRERPGRPDAVDYFLRARSVLDHDASLQSKRQAQRLLESAVSDAPDFVDALSELAIVLLHKISDFDDPDEVVDHAEAIDAVDHALRVAPQSAPAILARGSLDFADRKYEDAEAAFRVVASMDANNLRAISGLARCARMTGRFIDMIEDVKRLQRIDPTGPSSAALKSWIGYGYLLEGDPRSALTYLSLAGAEIAAPQSDAPLGWQEWWRLYLIAASQLTGHTQTASDLYRSYRASYPRRTAWLLSSYATHLVAILPGYQQIESAWIAAGMPRHIDETVDFHVAPPATPQIGNDFSPTPTSIPGGTVVSSTQLHALLSTTGDPPTILDAGRGAAVIPGANWIWTQGWWNNLDDILSRTITAQKRTQPLVVMGNGPLGWGSYNIALKLIAGGYTHVLWYRGGEDAWSAAGLPGQDRRTP